MQGTGVGSLVREDPTGLGATKPGHHNCWTGAVEPTSSWSPCAIELEPCNRRSHCIEKPTHHNRVAPTCRNWRKGRSQQQTLSTAKKIKKETLKENWCSCVSSRASILDFEKKSLVEVKVLKMIKIKHKGTYTDSFKDIHHIVKMWYKYWHTTRMTRYIYNQFGIFWHIFQQLRD